jgi:hypothetical protein
MEFKWWLSPDRMEAVVKGGEVRSFASGVLVTISIFKPKKQGRAVHIRIAGAGGKGTITTVTDDPHSVRYHPHLYGQLKMLLSDQGCWQIDEA